MEMKINLNRVFINLIKNSEESFLEKIEKDPNFKGNIDIEINDNNDYIIIRLTRQWHRNYRR